MLQSSIIVCFLSLNGFFLLSAVIAGAYTFVKSLMLLAVLKRKYPNSIEDLDVAGWNSMRAMKIINSDIGHDDIEIASLKRNIRVSQQIVLISILCCFLGFMALGIYILVWALVL